VTQAFELCVSSDMKKLVEVSDFVVRVAHTLDLHESVCFAVQMAVDEACANIMEHAYGGCADGSICISLRADTEEVVVIIRDHGQPFDPTAVTRPDPTAPLEERGEGALGLYLMEQLMDSVEFRFDTLQGNTLTMRKRLGGADQNIPCEC